MHILNASEKSIELMFDLERQGYSHVASVAKCGHPAKHYHVALVDWRRRTFRSLEATLNWLVDFLCEEGVLIVLTNPPEGAHAREHRCSAGKTPFIIENTVVEAGGYAVSARRRELKPIRKAA